MLKVVRGIHQSSSIKESKSEVIVGLEASIVCRELTEVIKVVIIIIVTVSLVFTLQEERS